MSFFLSVSKVETWTMSVSFAISRNRPDCLWRLDGQTSSGGFKSSVEHISFLTRQKRSSLAVTSSRDRIAIGARSTRFSPWPQLGKPWFRTLWWYIKEMFKNFGEKTFLWSKGKVSGPLGEDKRMWHRSLFVRRVFFIKLAHTVSILEGHCIRNNLSPLPNLITAEWRKSKVYKDTL